MMQQTDIAALMPSVAKALFGEPNKGRPGAHEWRYRGKGSLSIDLAKGTFFDWEDGCGGGVLDLIMRERKCGVGDALRWVEGVDKQAVRPAPVVVDPRRNDWLRASALRIWSECQPLAGSLAERYLVSRGLVEGAAVADLAFHPRCPFGKDDAGQQRFVPAMVGLVRSPVDGSRMGVHRTELTADGRKVDRKMLGACFGGVVKLSPGPVEGVLGACEGIETGLAVVQLGGGPVWACLTAGCLKRLPVFGGVSTLAIYADNDAPGLDAARDCARRWIAGGVSPNTSTGLASMNF